MNWLTPTFLFGVAALVLPLALHLLRRRVVTSTPFPALRFLAASKADQRQQLLRRRAVLALRCLALALLAAAFARPFLGAPPAPSARATVVVIDNSFSMQSGTRWEDLRRWTHDQIGSAATGDTLGLLLMNPRPSWLVAPTTDVSAALTALDALGPGWEATHAEPAVRLAGDVLAATPARERRLVFMGDHQAVGWTGADFTRQLPPGINAIFPSAAAAPASQAALSAATLSREDDAWIATVTVRNFTSRQSRVLQIFPENAVEACLTLPLDLSAGESKILRLPLPASVGTSPAYIRLSLAPDDLPADDSVWAIPPVTTTARQLLLDAGPAGGLADHMGTAFAALTNMPPALSVVPVPSAAWPPAALAILRNDTSFTGEMATRLDTFLAAGGSAFIFVHGGSAQRQWLADQQINVQPAAQPSARLRDWALEHPFIAPLVSHQLRNFIGWEFLRASSLPADKIEPLAFWEDGTVALGELRLGAGRVLIAGFSADRREGDFPVLPAYVPFLHQSASYLLGLASATGNTSRVGSAVILPESPGDWQALAGPANLDSKSSVSGSVQPATPGIYQFTQPGSPPQLYAIGLSPEESDPAPWSSGTPWDNLIASDKSAETPIATRLATASSEAENQNSLWWWAFAAMAIFALAELSLANRTTR